MADWKRVKSAAVGVRAGELAIDGREPSLTCRVREFSDSVAAREAVDDPLANHAASPSSVARVQARRLMIAQIAVQCRSKEVRNTSEI